MQITTDYKTEVKLEKVIGITDKMNLIELATYIESIRTALICSDVYHEIEEEIEHEHDKKGVPLAHMCSALSYLDLAEQALRLAHHARFRR